MRVFNTVKCFLQPMNIMQPHEKVDRYPYAARLVRVRSAVEHRTLNRETPGSNLICFRFEAWSFSLSRRRPSLFSRVNEYLDIHYCGNV